MRKGLLFLVIFYCLIVSSCHNYTIGTYKKETSEEISSFTQKDDMFKTSDNQFYVFETNNKSYLSSYGYTIWCLKKSNTNQDLFISAEVKKVCGSDKMGYGLVFSDFVTEQDKEKMQVILINTKGEYLIGEVENARFTVTKEWTNTSNLIQGYAAYNKISISYDRGNNLFYLYFNDQQECTFSPIINDFNNTKYGFVATIAPDENIDSSSVKIEYKLN